MTDSSLTHFGIPMSSVRSEGSTRTLRRIGIEGPIVGMLRDFLGRRTIVWPDNTVWLASYPRSGNTYLRAILWSCFGLQTGSVYPDDLSLDVSQHVGHF